MKCPYCQNDTAVINSRHQKRSNQVWRRRRCQGCGATFTTHELIHLPAVFIVKNRGEEEPFLPDKLFDELLVTLRGQNKAYETARELTAQITRRVLENASKGLILPQNISLETARTLKNYDRQAYLRFVAEHPSLQS